MRDFHSFMHSVEHRKIYSNACRFRRKSDEYSADPLILRWCSALSDPPTRRSDCDSNSVREPHYAGFAKSVSTLCAHMNAAGRNASPPPLLWHRWFMASVAEYRLQIWIHSRDAWSDLNMNARGFRGRSVGGEMDPFSISGDCGGGRYSGLPCLSVCLSVWGTVCVARLRTYCANGRKSSIFASYLYVD